jgi:two-component system sensor histidine kinase RpfC
VRPELGHSRQAGGTRALDEGTLESLEGLGGSDFVTELIEQFIADASTVLEHLSVQVKANNMLGFREQTHALRSAAANIGAYGLYELCLEWRDIDEQTLAEAGERYLEQLIREFERVRAALRERTGGASRGDTNPSPI